MLGWTLCYVKLEWALDWMLGAGLNAGLDAGLAWALDWVLGSTLKVTSSSPPTSAVSTLHFGSSSALCNPCRV